MKVIDLLNKIANGTEVPKKIKWEDTIWAYSEHDKDYLEYPFSEEEYKGLFCMKDSILTQYLNDEVEIIEDIPKDKKIEKLDLEDDGNTITLFGEKENEWTILDNVDIIVCNKINEIIDKINGE